MIRLVPRGRADLPVLLVIEVGSEWAFRCIDAAGEVQVETFHVNLGDALIQAGRTSSPQVVYDIECGDERDKALKDASQYLRIRAERLRQQQVKNYSGERARNINALQMWAREVRKL